MNKLTELTISEMLEFEGGISIAKVLREVFSGLLLDTISGDWEDLKQGYNDGLKRK